MDIIFIAMYQKKKNAKGDRRQRPEREGCCLFPSALSEFLFLFFFSFLSSSSDYVGEFQFQMGGKGPEDGWRKKEKEVIEAFWVVCVCVCLCVLCTVVCAVHMIHYLT